MRQKVVWHLKFRNSEMCVWCHVSKFQFQRLGKLKKTKGLGRILPSGRGLPHHRLQSLSSELQNLPWFRSIDLGFDCCRLWFEFRLPGEFLLGFVELGFRITLEFESSSSSVQAGSDILLLCGLLLVWISSALGYLWKPNALPSAFWKVNENTWNWRNSISLKKSSLQGKPILQRNQSFGFMILLLRYYYFCS